MVGIEFDKPGADIVSACLKRGLIINGTHDTILRLLPSMAATEAEIGEGLDIMEDVLTCG
jgi:acetylornithine/succinyldiaminopimelate/putrescine aminotransferase